MGIVLKNVDCMEYMSTIEDKFFDLAIADPEYGIGQNKNGGKSIGLRKKWIGYNKKKYSEKEWDNLPASDKYFIELFRVSKNQIVWGYNYFDLPTTKGIIAWDKQCDGTGFSHFELAYSSFDKAARIFRYPIQGESQNRIHPTQKPVALYKWLLKNYGENCKSILDTHGGSMSIALACHDLGYDLVLCEKDNDHFNNGSRRYQNHIAQTTLF